MDRDRDLHDEDDNDRDGEIGGAFVTPSSKVRLPEHVTKLGRRDRGEQDADDERAV